MWLGKKRESNMTAMRGKIVKNQASRMIIAHPYPFYRNPKQPFGFTPHPRKGKKSSYRNHGEVFLNRRRQTLMTHCWNKTRVIRQTQKMK